MNREQHIARAANLRKGKTTAKIALDKHERRYTASTTDHESLNLAKKASGLRAVSLQRGEHFPPLLEALPVIEEPQEESVAA